MNVNKVNNYDIIIVGGGPNGIYCLYEFNKIFPKKKIILLEKKLVVNNIFSYPNVLWHSTMGELKLPSYLNQAINDLHQPTSNEVAKYFKHFSEEHNLNILENHEVTNISSIDNKNYNLEVKKENETINFNSKVVILSTGIYENVNKLEIDVDNKFCTHHMDINNENKNIVLVGGGNSAADFIIYQLQKNKIHWVIKYDEWRSIFSNLVNKFDEVTSKYKDNLIIYKNTKIKKIYSNNKIELSDGKLIQSVDKCYLLIGCNSKNQLFNKIGLKYDNKCLYLDENYQTNLKNIYAFGSIMTKWSHQKNRPQPAYIHNGNPIKLKKIVNGIIKNEAKAIIAKENLNAIDEKQKNNFVINFIKKIKSNFLNI